MLKLLIGSLVLMSNFLLYFRYSKNLIEAKNFGIKKSMISGGGLGLTFFVIFASYALAFWYGGKLTRDEPENYTIGVMLIVSSNSTSLRVILTGCL